MSFHDNQHYLSKIVIHEKTELHAETLIIDDMTIRGLISIKIELAFKFSLE